ncbi:hypothetical protein C8F01DRAFT_1151450 [Mycena amicta]|nr:hypothetical protein C8F01DRAFT_1151450 [Mycena amicta]
MVSPVFDIPSSTSTVSVKMYDLISDHSKVKSSAASFFQPVLPGHETLTCPVFAFLIENQVTKQRVMFDLGPRKDLENAVPWFAAAVKAGLAAMPVEKDIAEQLVEDGVPLESISAVIWSHAHADHTGDMTLFPPSVDLVLSADMSLDTYETSQYSHLLPSDLVGHKIVPIDLKKASSEIGGFRAHNYFGDGSFYLLDVPGHQAGHICALARVTPTSFILLGADACHHAGVLRPTALLHKHFPCPGALLSATRTSVSHTHFTTSAAGLEFDLLARTTPLLTVATNGYFEDLSNAFDARPDVFVVLAHDASLLSVVGQLPAVLDDWHARDLKKASLWTFLEEKNPAFRFNAKA